MNGSIGNVSVPLNFYRNVNGFVCTQGQNKEYQEEEEEPEPPAPGTEDLPPPKKLRLDGKSQFQVCFIENIKKNKV